MRVGIFGGTFNPPHLGHINMCKLFLDEIALDSAADDTLGIPAPYGFSNLNNDIMAMMTLLLL